eukprot:jgi/Mesvir1/21140/Mv14189-RA.1
MRLTECHLSNSGALRAFPFKSATLCNKPQSSARMLRQQHVSRSASKPIATYFNASCSVPRAGKFWVGHSQLNDKVRWRFGSRQLSVRRSRTRASSDHASGTTAEEAAEEDETGRTQAGGNGKAAAGDVRGWVRSRWETVSGAVKDPSARQHWRGHLNQARHEAWRRILAVWHHPICKRIFLSLSLANITIRAAEVSALLSTLLPASLPAMAPFVVGAGLVLRTVMRDASVVLPRLGTCCCILYLLWAVNAQLKRWLHAQHVLSSTISRAITIAAEMASGAITIFTVLTTFGVNMYSILLPAAVTLALASKDIAHNFLAGFFLFSAEPFKPGDYVSVVAGAPLANSTGAAVLRRPAGGVGDAVPNGSAPRPAASSALPSAAPLASPSWFRGVCESIDLRYTVLRDGRQHLYVPNSVFMTTMFLVEVEPEGGEAAPDEEGGIMPTWAGTGVEEELNGHARGGQGEPVPAGAVAAVTPAVPVAADVSAAESAKGDVPEAA